MKQKGIDGFCHASALKILLQPKPYWQQQKNMAMQKELRIYLLSLQLPVNMITEPKPHIIRIPGRWDIGLKLFLGDLKVLDFKGSPYENLRVMVHLDHVQFDDDKELLSWDMDAFSSIMFDASKLSFEENMKLTKQFVKEQGIENCSGRCM